MCSLTDPCLATHCPQKPQFEANLEAHCTRLERGTGGCISCGTFASCLSSGTSAVCAATVESGVGPAVQAKPVRLLLGRGPRWLVRLRGPVAAHPDLMVFY